MARNVLLTLRKPVAGEDEAGQASTAWQFVAQIWAEGLALTGLQAIRADAKTSDVKASFRIRPRADIVAGWSVQHGTSVYEVKAVLPDLQRRMHQDLVCELLP